ncbi:MAG TPA: PAS domain-containing protein, partial [Aggregatilineales bacterium]|nr:PAS domain-containing protein [Aggregatilineales bacterium]
MHAFLERFDIRVSAAYGIIATLWIVFSDALVGLVFAANQSMTVTFGLLKGLGFVCVTTLALYAVLSAEWRKRISAERALFEERNLLRTLIDILPDRIYAKDSEGRFVLKNQCDLRQMGAASLQESIGKTDFDYYPLELARQYHADDQAVIQSGQPLVDHEEPVTAADGTQGWILTTKIPLRDNQGRVIGLVGIGRDITERRRVEETLTEERNLLRTLIDTIPDSIYVKDSQSRFLMNNLAHMQGLGAAPADLIGKTDFDFFPREQAERFFADDQAVIQTGQPLRHREEVVTHTVTGDRLWMDATKAPLRDRTGKIIGLVGISHNITALKQTEQALEQERTLLRTIIDNVPDYIFVKDRAGHFIASNMAHTQSVQSLRSGAIIGKTALEVYPPKLGQQFHDDDLQVLETGDALINAERRTISPDGSDRWVLTSKVPLKDAAGCVTGLIGISRDITERRQMD